MVGSPVRMIPMLTRPQGNTDGADTIRSSHISFNNWTVYNGDDSISLKGNSTNISITNSHFHNGLGIAIGSIGQYDGEYEIIQGLTVDNVTFTKTQHAVMIPCSITRDYPPTSRVTYRYRQRVLMSIIDVYL